MRRTVKPAYSENIAIVLAFTKSVRRLVEQERKIYGITGLDTLKHRKLLLGKIVLYGSALSDVILQFIRRFTFPDYFKIVIGYNGRGIKVCEIRSIFFGNLHRKSSN
jgi:hypothetical protein